MMAETWGLGFSLSEMRFLCSKLHYIKLEVELADSWFMLLGHNGGLLNVNMCLHRWNEGYVGDFMTKGLKRLRNEHDLCPAEPTTCFFPT